MSKEKRTANDIEITTLQNKIEQHATQTPLKTGSKLRCSEWVSSSCSTSGTRRVAFVTSPMLSH
jgi:hypothetical protein